jgi:hypothetical protein
MKRIMLASFIGLAACGAETSGTCGSSTWSVADQATQAPIFGGKATCTEFLNAQTISVTLSGTASIVFTFPGSGSFNCTNGVATVELTTDANQPYAAGSGNPPPPGSSCSVDVGTIPAGPGLVTGTLLGVAGRCTKVGGCASAGDWEAANISGDFRAYSHGL